MDLGNFILQIKTQMKRIRFMSHKLFRIITVNNWSMKLFRSRVSVRPFFTIKLLRQVWSFAFSDDEFFQKSHVEKLHYTRFILIA